MSVMKEVLSRNSQHLITTPATAEICRRCRKAIWLGQYLGFTVKAEPMPVDMAREAIARIHGRRVFQTVREGFGFTLKLRGLDDILKSPKETKVLPEHNCATSPFATHIDFFAQSAPVIHEGEYPF